MARIRVLGGDFVEHPSSSYFMGEFTLWGWKEGQTKPLRMQFRVRKDVADVQLRSSDAMPTGAQGISGAARGALVGASLGGPVGAVAGAIVGGTSSAAAAKMFNKAQRGNRQRFVVTFNDGRKLEAEMDVRIVAGLQNRLVRKMRRATAG